MNRELEQRLILLAVGLRSDIARDVVLDALYALRRHGWSLRGLVLPPTHRLGTAR